MARTLEKKTLTDWRKTRGLSVEEFAERIEVSKGAAGDYLRGRKEPGVLRAIRMAEALGVKVEQIAWDADMAPRPTAEQLPAMPEGDGVTPERLAVAREWLTAGATKAEVARALNVSRAKLYTYL